LQVHLFSFVVIPVGVLTYQLWVKIHGNAVAHIKYDLSTGSLMAGTT